MIQWWEDKNESAPPRPSLLQRIVIIACILMALASWLLHWLARSSEEPASRPRYEVLAINE